MVRAVNEKLIDNGPLKETTGILRSVRMNQICGAAPFKDTGWRTYIPALPILESADDIRPTREAVAVTSPTKYLVAQPREPYQIFSSSAYKFNCSTRTRQKIKKRALEKKEAPILIPIFFLEKGIGRRPSISKEVRVTTNKIKILSLPKPHEKGVVTLFNKQTLTLIPFIYSTNLLTLHSINFELLSYILK